MRLLFLILGLGCTGYYVYVTGMGDLNESYASWVFEQRAAGREDLSVAGYLRQAPAGFLVRDSGAAKDPVADSPPILDAPRIELATGAILGKIEIERLHLSAVVREGVDASTLSSSVGHVPSSALPGQPGNFALAAHRDTLFRPLKDIKQDDLIAFRSLTQTFIYQVKDTRIVKPTDVSVLRPDGHDSLTLITCYPFYYVGSAPERFIVQARLVSETKPAGSDQLEAAARE